MKRMRCTSVVSVRVACSSLAVHRAAGRRKNKRRLIFRFTMRHLLFVFYQEKRRKTTLLIEHVSKGTVRNRCYLYNSHPCCTSNGSINVDAVQWISNWNLELCIAESRCLSIAHVAGKLDVCVRINKQKKKKTKTNDVDMAWRRPSWPCGDFRTCGRFRDGADKRTCIRWAIISNGRISYTSIISL